MNEIKITHGIFKGGRIATTRRGIYYIKLPEQVKIILTKRYNKWLHKGLFKNKRREIHFTIGRSDRVVALAITNPNDNFKRSVGRKLVEDRINLILSDENLMFIDKINLKEEKLNDSM